jgi:cytochrome P450
MTVTDPRPFPFRETPALEIDEAFAELRRDRPTIRIQMAYGEPAWLVSRYEDVKTVLGDPRFSRELAAHRDEPRSRPRQGEPDTILSFDPPEHSRLRRLVMKAFTIRRIEQLRPWVQGLADELVDRMLEHGSPADLVDGFALPLPVTVICELLGVPYEDRDDFRLWSDAFLSTSRFTPEQVEEYAGRLRGYMAGLVAQRRAEPREDMITALVAARDEEDRLSEAELLSLLEAILVAGHETTASQIPNFVYTLLTHPDQLALLRSDLDLVPRAVEELMRFVPLGAGGGIARYAREDVELSGVLVRAGEAVTVSLPSANRDESVFPAAERLDLAREGASHVGFGHGPHHCLGAPLARMELQVALRTLLERLPGLRLDDPTGEGVVWKAGLSTRSPEHMSVAWD